MVHTRSDPEAEFRACQSLLAAGQIKAALPRLAGLARKAPRHGAVLWLWAQAADQAGEARQASVALERLTLIEPTHAAAWFLLARQLRRLAQ